MAISNRDIVVGAYAEDGDGSSPTNNGCDDAGAAYVFTLNGQAWLQQAYLKAANPGVSDAFGWSVAISRSTLVVGAPFEDSGDGTAASNTSIASGAAYTFGRIGTAWSQQAYLKAENRDAADAFGYAVSLAFDTLAVGAPYESSNATSITTTSSTDNSAPASGATYVYITAANTWAQQAYLKAANGEAGDQFGAALALSGDVLAVGAVGEDSDAAGVSSVASASNAASQSGAVYAHSRSGTNWTQDFYLKASSSYADESFGSSLAAFGSQIAAGGRESPAQSGIVHAYGNTTPITLRQAWRLAHFGGSRDAGLLADTADADSDGVPNLAEYAFGTDPTLSSSGGNLLIVDGANIVARGSPATRTTTSGTSVNFRALFGRRKDWAAAGLSYTVQFSGNLTQWASSAATPAVLASDASLDAVTVPYPFFVLGTKARFFRVQVSATTP